MLDVLKYKNIITTKSPYAVVRYADDFVIFAKTQGSCSEVKLKLVTWLKERGLELSEEKTRIVNLEEGFDFLGFNVRRYKTNLRKKGCILLTKPSKKSIENFKNEMRQAWKEVIGWKRVDAIRYLNQKIIGWGNYFKIGASKRTFGNLDHWMFGRQVRYLYRMHPNKHWHWFRRQYYGIAAGRKDMWVFQDKISGIYLEKLSWIPIKRHVMVQGNASPDNPQLQEYWQNRQKKKNLMISTKKQILWRKQQGLCPSCRESLDNGEMLHLHHIRPKSLGGKDTIVNLVMLHAGCHRQIHSIAAGKDVALGLLEPYAG